ncbi:MAG: hypothetical protein HOL80_02065 [Candidatus Magasanikbacteria bacterium]|jgi:hypothetical protein|nr:hypothetical protein [Candidatus Magasanikbacteria bacterium]MBT5262664.1 hypothetical protein [Candidatus Magasanikbacteria bacterium]MBT5820285.1 hypothetical protein [Candidatus Magasanikbacteria bacterium]MBT6294548.1 hypothetical protein [Candidatus Magasanikbacteria bacterium]
MILQSFDRLFDIARRTGDKLIVHDPHGGYDMVVMGVDKYLDIIENKRNIRHLTKDQMQDRINRDIAVWRSHNEKIKQDDLLYTLEKELSSDPNEVEKHKAPTPEGTNVATQKNDVSETTPQNFTQINQNTGSGLAPLGNIMKQYIEKNNLQPFQDLDSEIPVVEPIHEYDKDSPHIMRYEVPDISNMSSKQGEYVLREEGDSNVLQKKQIGESNETDNSQESAIYFEEPL